MSDMTFENAMKRLEEIVSKLERGDLTLEESIKVYEEGLQLNKFCSAKLDETEKKIKMLVKDKDGFKLKPSDDLG
ncbi:exodeoxyribonuclease VII small subunit [candidate division KSB1 bacterium]|nr:exodeoxyribonuclease VII small subunit [candidate division KSB1 bacterium]NIR72271.1 exodeoxyribonuclease VII small subunit [candidate division KSB1 bacterium]NIS24242.1 exodeoxyribonuclease VII small subunit [candidate division KSB1 bacterium]NIT71156.1 exodeoxyribonuclease VII small subunit [candidate division KSB1 bacterium]NIU24861.1 exodeoxyribonuclease VII small subunit [candidate division KSB1 bacterium]